VTRTDWNPVLRAELDAPYFADLRAFVAAERAASTVYPPPALEFAALHRTPYTAVKVVIVGQDPYHGPGQAEGLCFSVPDGVAIPPSLRNILAELRDDLGVPPARSGSLHHWADQGVLLLNSTLTVRAGAAGSHVGRGWERFTDAVLGAVDRSSERVVFVLWGAAARRKRSLVTGAAHVVIESAHPSPLSAHNGFLGSRPFSRVNEALVAAGRAPVEWAPPMSSSGGT